MGVPATGSGGPGGCAFANIAPAFACVPMDMIGGLVYLAGSRSDFVTGQGLFIDGGVVFH